MRTFVVSLIVVTFILIAILCVKRIGTNTAIPRELLLVTATNQWHEADFLLPDGKNFDLVFGIPQEESHGEQISGEILLLNRSKVVTNFSFNVGSSTRASWLSDHKLDAYILTWPTNEPSVRLDAMLTPASKYALVITFSNRPPEYGSLWLIYLAPAPWFP